MLALCRTVIRRPSVLSNHSKRQVSKSLSTDSKDASSDTQSESKPLSLYCWGTSQKGSIPTKDVLEEGRSGGASATSSLLNRKGSVFDHPVKIDLEDAFGKFSFLTTWVTSCIVMMLCSNFIPCFCLCCTGDKNISIRDIECGPTSTAVITSDNTAYTFGFNSTYGQLGTGDKNDVLIPTLLSPPDSTPLRRDQISKIALGQNMSAIIDTNGDLYTMGYNGSVMGEGVGCLGHGYSKEYLLVPTLVQSLVEDGCKAKQVVVGNSHMTVLTDQGEVLVSGSGQYGRCGNLDPVDQLFLEPVELLMGETDICHIASGKEYTLALTEKEGIIFSWGRNDKGQCGSGSGLSVEMYAMESMPVAVEGMLEGRKVVKMDAGYAHAAALTDKGELFIWGSVGQPQPELVTALGHTRIVDVTCGQDYTIALDHEGKIYSFGRGKTGVLGLASEKFAVEPTLVEGMLGKKVVKLQAGWKHVACLAEDLEE